jgi:hypothetical protein
MIQHVPKRDRHPNKPLIMRNQKQEPNALRNVNTQAAEPLRRFRSNPDNRNASLSFPTSELSFQLSSSYLNATRRRKPTPGVLSERNANGNDNLEDNSSLFSKTPEVFFQLSSSWLAATERRKPTPRKLRERGRQPRRRLKVCGTAT